MYKSILKPPSRVQAHVTKNLSGFGAALDNPALSIKAPHHYDSALCVSGRSHRSTQTVQGTPFCTAGCGLVVCTGVQDGVIQHRAIPFVPSFINTPTPVVTPHSQATIKPKLTELLQSFGKLRHRCLGTKNFATTLKTKSVASLVLYPRPYRCGATKTLSLQLQTKLRSYSVKGLTWTNLQKTCMTMH